MTWNWNLKKGKEEADCCEVSQPNKFMEEKGGEEGKFSQEIENKASHVPISLMVVENLFACWLMNVSCMNYKK